MICLATGMVAATRTFIQLVFTPKLNSKSLTTHSPESSKELNTVSFDTLQPLLTLNLTKILNQDLDLNY